ncbi:MAG TPA: YihY/virulence factor BrkB family protein [Granulicella sp.]|nr:YihY/virulence factor BrkB family protein [Granulicella sp.]
MNRLRGVGADGLQYLLHFFAPLRRTLEKVLDHDCLNIAQAAAYSAMVSLFPALIVAASVITLLPDAAPLRLQAAQFFDRILPPDVSPLLESYFATSHRTPQSVRALLVLVIVSVTGASSVIVTLMEGFRRAYDLPNDLWGFWDRRWRSFALVPISLFPLLIVSLLVVFGHFLAEWILMYVGAPLRVPVAVIAFLLRWAVALAGSVGIIAVIYHMGVPPACLGPELEDPNDGRLWGSVRTMRAMSTMERSWRRTLPGAVLATVMWFVTTLIFGWYVTRFANYSEVYGSLGTGVALLFWLYIILLSVLCGAEFNAQLYSAGPVILPPTTVVPVEGSKAEGAPERSIQ